MSVAAPLMYRGGCWSTSAQALHSDITTRVKRVTLVYLFHVNRWDNHKKISIAKFDFVQATVAEFL